MPQSLNILTCSTSTWLPNRTTNCSSCFRNGSEPRRSLFTTIFLRLVCQFPCIPLHTPTHTQTKLFHGRLPDNTGLTVAPIYTNSTLVLQTSPSPRSNLFTSNHSHPSVCPGCDVKLIRCCPGYDVKLIWHQQRMIFCE